MTGKGMKLSSFAKYLYLRVINREASRKVLFLAAVFAFAALTATAQEAPVKPSKGEALAAWDRGNYELAYEHFNGLLLLYSRDPLYRYYTGACLVEMERDIPRAVNLLGSAINSSVNLKSVPDEVWFFYGRALQMDGSFDQATEAYKRFEKDAGRKIAQGYEVQKYLEQCSLKQGSLSRNSAPVAAPAPVAVVTAPRQEQAKDQVTTTPGHDIPAARGEVSEVPGEYFLILEDGLQKQHEADSLNDRADKAATGAGITDSGRPGAEQGSDTDMAGRAAESQKKADSLFLILGDNSKTTREQPSAFLTEPTPSYLLTRFEVRQGQAYSEKNPVPVDNAMPSGLIYSIQIAAFRNTVSPSLFRGLYPVYGKLRKESGTTYYYTGLFRRLNDARLALPEARKTGFPDAFIIALMDGTQVSMERAVLLEKEWADKPLEGQDPVRAQKNSQELTGQVPVVTLSFRAEVMRLNKPVKPEMVEKLELLAGNRGLDMIKNNVGETVVLIGNFITFESADDYVSLLIRNGYSTARVAAYVGTREIPVEAARELLNKPPDD
jgi:hypothetical protein